jgi:Protein of unknown function (DUF3631)
MNDANDVEPLPEVSGADLLDEVHDTVTKYVAFANVHQPVAGTLWTAATHGIRSCHHATRLVVRSPQKRCGKSRLLDVIAGLSFSPMLTTDATTPTIFRSIGDNDDAVPTLFFDEADALFGTKKAAEQNEDLRALLNAGWQRDRPAWRCVGPQQIPTPFNTFAMAALAAIGHLPDTITDRGVTIDLKRRAPSERVSKFRVRRDRAALTDLSGKLNRWVRDRDRADRLEKAEPKMPEGIEDRAEDAWEPLLAIADEAGGDWPERARAACLALVSVNETSEADSLSIKLLSDTNDIFVFKGMPFLSSNALVEALRAIKESPWETFDLTANGLAHRLKGYGIRPGPDTTGRVRGYRLEWFEDTFERYLSRGVSRTVKPSNSASGQGEPSDTSESSDTPGCQNTSTDESRVSGCQEPSNDSRRSSLVFDGLTPSDAPMGGNGAEPHSSKQPTSPSPPNLCDVCRTTPCRCSANGQAAEEPGSKLYDFDAFRARMSAKYQDQLQ